MCLSWTLVGTSLLFWGGGGGGGGCECRAVYKVFDLIGHFVLASQGLLGHCTFVMEIAS